MKIRGKERIKKKDSTICANMKEGNQERKMFRSGINEGFHEMGRDIMQWQSETDRQTSAILLTISHFRLTDGVSSAASIAYSTDLIRFYLSRRAFLNAGVPRYIQTPL
jgi:hypothetical protein